MAWVKLLDFEPLLALKQYLLSILLLLLNLSLLLLTYINNIIMIKTYA